VAAAEALAELEALADVAAAAGVEEVAELAVLEELEDEPLLHAVAASPTQAMAAKAAIRAPRR